MTNNCLFEEKNKREGGGGGGWRGGSEGGLVKDYIFSEFFFSGILPLMGDLIYLVGQHVQIIKGGHGDFRAINSAYSGEVCGFYCCLQ